MDVLPWIVVYGAWVWKSALVALVAGPIAWVWVRPRISAKLRRRRLLARMSPAVSPTRDRNDRVVAIRGHVDAKGETPRFEDEKGVAASSVHLGRGKRETHLASSAAPGRSVWLSAPPDLVSLALIAGAIDDEPLASELRSAASNLHEASLRRDIAVPLAVLRAL